MAVDLDKLRDANLEALYGPDAEVEFRADGGTRVRKRSVEELRTQQGLLNAAEERAARRHPQPVTVCVGSPGMWR